MTPTVSVVIPCYNSGKTLARAIASVRRQGLPGVETVVVDDASRDDTAAVASAAGPDVRLLRLDRNGGASRARNAGIAAARGAFVAFLDADDEWLPGKLARQLDIMARQPRIGLVATDAEALWRGETQAFPVYPAENRPVGGAEAWRALLAYPYVLTSSVLIRTAVLREVGPFDETLPVAEDQDMWIRIALRHEIAYLPEVLVLKHNDYRNLSYSNPLGGVQYGLPMVKAHLDALGDRLSPGEARAILARRLRLEGRNAYYRGDYWRGLAMLSQAVMMADEPLRNALFVVKHAPPARWLRRLTGDRIHPSAQIGGVGE